MGRRGDWVKDLFFPKFCILCKQEGVWLCKNCKPGEMIAQHISSAELAGLNSVISLCEYGDNALSELIKILKYNCVEEVLEEIKEIIFSTPICYDWRDAVLVPVPLHVRRQRERGFNQAEKIAELFSDKYKVPVHHSLHRRVYTAQQVTLSGMQRRDNMQGAFLFKTGAVVPRKAVIVDDIFTTGSTMKECAAALRMAGVEQVAGLVLATGRSMEA